MSKVTYGSGMFHLRMKIPGGYTAGVVTSFYVSVIAPCVPFPKII